MTEVRPGRYTHRFNGAAVDQNGTPYFLAGVGTMTLTAAAKGLTLSGRQESVTLPTKGYGGQVVRSVYDLSGTVRQQPGQPLWEAVITFTQVGAKPPIIMEDTFVMAASGTPDRYWAISTAPRIVQGGNVVPTEAVSGEIERTGD